MIIFRYIRHRGNKLYVDMSSNSPAFKKESTFNIRYGLAATHGKFGLSFESYNNAGWFIGGVGGRMQMVKMV